MNYTEEKDSLSVRVAFVKVNIARTRRVFARMPSMMGGESSSNVAPPGATNSTALIALNGVAIDDDMSNFGRTTANSNSFNDVKLSVIADIGTTSFVYDMRNIKEVFVFPKIWYRRSLARRVFLGEETVINDPAAAAAASDHRGETHAKTDSKSSFEHASQKREKRGMDEKIYRLRIKNKN